MVGGSSRASFETRVDAIHRIWQESKRLNLLNDIDVVPSRGCSFHSTQIMARVVKLPDRIADTAYIILYRVRAVCEYDPYLQSRRAGMLEILADRLRGLLKPFE